IDETATLRILGLQVSTGAGDHVWSVARQEADGAGPEFQPAGQRGCSDSFAARKAGGRKWRTWEYTEDYKRASLNSIDSIRTEFLLGTTPVVIIPIQFL